MASANFSSFIRALATGGHNFSSDTLKVMLVSSIPTESDLDTWSNRSDVTNEITGAGYTAGGIDQPYVLDDFDIVNNEQTITLTDISNGWTAATISAVGAIIYKNSGAAATDKLMSFVGFGATVSVTNGNYSITYTSPLAIGR